MKRLATILGATFLGVITLTTSLAPKASAQTNTPYSIKDHDHDARFFIGGVLAYWNNTKEKRQVAGISPELGYLFNNDWGVGLLLGYQYNGYERSEGVKRSSNAFKFSPFVRYYYLHKAPFNLYLDSGIAFNYQRKDFTSTSPQSGWEIGLRPGACFDLTEGLCLCLRIGFIGYRKNFFMGEEPQVGENGFGILIAPEDLKIGLEFEF